MSHPHPASQTKTVPTASPGHAHRALRLEVRDMGLPDEVKSPPNCKIETLRMQGKTFTRFTFFPGFRWSRDVGPLLGLDRCPMTHVLYQVSGTLGLQMADGTERVLVAGQAQVIPPGHEAWVIGDEAWVAVAIE
ncbi:MAG TPA: hypothetical protein VM327_10165 [Candidatus Thermoplasmatota archaeon]|nr:hypothetical protein [Candidatus Thermoplasmatota archaeon]